MLNLARHCVKLLLLIGLLATGWGWALLAQSTGAKTNAVSAAPRSAGFSLPYKKDGKTAALFTSPESPKPLSLSQVQIKNLQVETYTSEGIPNLRGLAPDCVLDLNTKQASSAGPLTIQQVGGAFSLTGVGFSWNQESERLVLSNRVQATFRLSARPSPLLTRP